MNEQLNSLLPKIDFEAIPIVDSKWMYIFDKSSFKHLEKEVKYIGIKVPGSKKFTEHYYSSNTINMFNSRTLGLSSSNEIDELISLPDGVYEVEVYICNGLSVKETKLFFRYDTLQENIDKKILKIGIDYKTSHTKLDDIYKLLEGAKSFARCGEFTQAMRLYGQIDSMLNYL